MHKHPNFLRTSILAESGGRLNKRCRLTSIGITMLKIRRSRQSLIFNMRIHIPGKDVFYSYSKETHYYFFHIIQLVLLRSTICGTISLHVECDPIRQTMCCLVGLCSSDPIGDPVAYIKPIQSYVRRCLLPWRKHQRCTKLLPQPRDSAISNMVLYCSRPCVVGIWLPRRMS